MMTLGAFFAWIWLPDVQDGVDLDVDDSDDGASESGDTRGNGNRRAAVEVRAMTWYKLKNKRLEVLAGGRELAVGTGENGEGQVLGFREKMGLIPFPPWFRSGRE